jgi:hypothetical protein
VKRPNLSGDRSPSHLLNEMLALLPTRENKDGAIFLGIFLRKLPTTMRDHLAAANHATAAGHVRPCRCSLGRQVRRTYRQPSRRRQHNRRCRNERLKRQPPPFTGPPFTGPPFAGPPFAGPPFAGPPPPSVPTGTPSDPGSGLAQERPLRPLLLLQSVRAEGGEV